VTRSKNAWSYTFTPQYAFMAWCLVKYRDNFIFTFIFNETKEKIFDYADQQMEICICDKWTQKPMRYEALEKACKPLGYILNS
jgi:hypothetical protein